MTAPLRKGVCPGPDDGGDIDVAADESRERREDDKAAAAIRGDLRFGVVGCASITSTTSARRLPACRKARAARTFQLTSRRGLFRIRLLPARLPVRSFLHALRCALHAENGGKTKRDEFRTPEKGGRGGGRGGGRQDAGQQTAAQPAEGGRPLCLRAVPLGPRGPRCRMHRPWTASGPARASGETRQAVMPPSSRELGLPTAVRCHELLLPADSLVVRGTDAVRRAARTPALAAHLQCTLLARPASTDPALTPAAVERQRQVHVSQDQVTAAVHTTGTGSAGRHRVRGIANYSRPFNEKSRGR